MKKYFTLYIAIVFLFIWSVDQVHAKKKPKSPPIINAELTVGALLILSGEGAYGGQAAEQAIKLAVKNLNQAFMRERSKNRVMLQIEDTEGKPKVALRKLKWLHQNDVRIVIGPQSSAEVEAVLNFANKNDIILMSPSSAATSLAKAGDNLFRFSPDTNMQAQATVDLLTKDGIKSIIVVHRDDVWGEDLAKAIATKFKGNVVKVLSYKSDTDDYSGVTGSLLKNVSESREKYGAEQTAVVLLSFYEAASILVDADRYPLLSKVRWYGSSATAQNPQIVRDSDAAEFAVTTVYKNPAQKFSPTKGKGRVITNQLRQRIKRQPSIQTLAAYDATWIAAKTYYQVGLSNLKTYKNALMEKTASYNGLTGPTKLNKAGDRIEVEFDVWVIKKIGGRYGWKVIH